MIEPTLEERHSFLAAKHKELKESFDAAHSRGDFESSAQWAIECCKVFDEACRVFDEIQALRS